MRYRFGGLTGWEIDPKMDDKRLSWGLANAVASESIKLRSGLKSQAKLLEAVIARLTIQAHGFRHPTIIKPMKEKKHVR